MIEAERMDGQSPECRKTTHSLAGNRYSISFGIVLYHRFPQEACFILCVIVVPHVSND
jgi:hypothetical protein